MMAKSTGAEQVNDFCSKASAYIHDDLIPFMERLSTAAALRENTADNLALFIGM